MVRLKHGLFPAVMAIVVGGCTLPGPLANLPGLQQVANTIAQPRVTEADFTMIEDPVLRKHMVAQANATAYRMRSSSDGMDSGQVSVQEVKVNGDSFAMSTWQEVSGKKQNEMIMIDDTTYLKDYSDNAWWKQTSKSEEVVAEDAEEVSSEPVDFKEEYQEVAAEATYKSLGEEPCGDSAPNLTCYKYQETNGLGGKGARTFWFDTKSHLLRRDETAFGEYTSKTLYEYDNINVSAPKPTKDVPEGRNIYEYMSVNTELMPPSTQGGSGFDTSTYMPSEMEDSYTPPMGSGEQESFDYDSYEYSE
jgi:hypothetical protein